jgi:hypothetical protein
VTNKNEFGPTRETRLKGVVDFYLANYHDRQHDLAHYFRNLYRIVKLVHESGIPNERHVCRHHSRPAFQF